jgi:tetratricopeptide (TPR) repeat protein
VGPAQLLTCSSGSIPDHLLADLGVTLPASRALTEAGLIGRNARGVMFRHDLCRLAIASVTPAGAEPRLHRRLIEAYEATSHADPAVLTHHAVGAADVERIRRAAYDAGTAAARSGAHTQAAEFFTLALEKGGRFDPADEAELLELLAGEFYLIDRLEDAIGACRRAMMIREGLGELAAVSADHHSLAVYQWYNANRELAERHAKEAMSVLDAESGGDGLVQLGHAFAMQAYLAVQCSDLGQAAALISRAREIADTTNDSALAVRVRLIENYGAMLNGDEAGREVILSILRAGPKNVDELYSGGWSNVTYLDVEQRRLDLAADLLDVTIPLMYEHDLPICRVWQTGSRARLQLLVGEWDDALADADRVLEAPSAPLARTWPLLIRAMVGDPKERHRSGRARRGVAAGPSLRRTDANTAGCRRHRGTRMAHRCRRRPARTVPRDVGDRARDWPGMVARRARGMATAGRCHHRRRGRRRCRRAVPTAAGWGARVRGRGVSRHVDALRRCTRPDRLR